MKPAFVVGLAALGGLAWYLYSKRAAAAAALPAAAPGATSSSSSASEFTMPALSLQTFAAPSLSAPILPALSLAPISVNVSPLPFSSLNIMGPQTGPTPASFWAGLTPEPLFSSSPFASAIAFPSGATLPLSQAQVRMDASGNSYVMQGGVLYQLSGPSGGYYTASVVNLP